MPPPRSRRLPPLTLALYLEVVAASFMIFMLALSVESAIVGHAWFETMLRYA
jgi:hypothetical protein